VDVIKPGFPFCPEQKYEDPAQLSQALTSRVLPLVSRPARYIGGELGAIQPEWPFDFAKILLAFPDVYEIGMSHTGLRVLYSQLKRHPQAYADFVFTPWPDMENQMRKEQMPLFGLGSRRPANQFDVIAFSLCYELTYTNLLTMIDLAGIPLLASERKENDPVIVAGGACTLNPTVIAEFLDVIFLGDGEETIGEVADAVNKWRLQGGGRVALCDQLATIPGAWRSGGEHVRSRALTDLNRVKPPDDLVPVIEPVHDRLSLEVMRGCVRGCRFCQAGMINRPVRERNVATLVEAAANGVNHGGWHELSLLSLSTSDYTALADSVAQIQERLRDSRTNLVLPSLRVDSVDEDLYEWISRQKPATFTFAPEAGSQRLRDLINKQITEDDVLRTVEQAFRAGAKKLKLYFMIGLPTETDADLDALVDMVAKVVKTTTRGGSQVTVSISPFVPKPHTPFQWAGQIAKDEIRRRNRYVEERLRKLKVKISLRDPELSALEALLGIGDAKVGQAVWQAWRLGARFDGWTEWFEPQIWQHAFSATGIDPVSYLAPLDPTESLPWDHVEASVSKDFLQLEWERALAGETLRDCRLAGECYDCTACSGLLDHVFAVTESGERAARELNQFTRTHKGSTAEIAESFDERNASPEDPTHEKRNWSIWRQQAAEKCWYRAEYTKDGDSCFVGHLDFQRQLHLALRRASLPIAYSRGYHPHPLLKFGPPLPVGVTGSQEAFDIAFQREISGWEENLNKALPPGLKVLRSLPMGASIPKAIDQCVSRFIYRVILPPAQSGGPTLADSFRQRQQFLASEHWPFLRQRPKGDVEVDARAMVSEDDLEILGTERETTDDPGGVVLRVSLHWNTGETNLSIHDFLAALCGMSLPDPRLCQIRRIAMFGRSTLGMWQTPLEEVGEGNRRLWLRRRLYA